MTDIKHIMHMINWDNDQQTQEKGIQLARRVKDIKLFIQPTEYGNKSVWENCAKVLSEKTDAVLEPYLFSLLEWLQDINWPGAIIVLERLKKYSALKLREPFECCVKQAIKCNDNEWLDYLSELLDHNELKKMISKNCLMELEMHYKNWGKG